MGMTVPWPKIPQTAILDSHWVPQPRGRGTITVICGRDMWTSRLGPSSWYRGGLQTSWAIQEAARGYFKRRKNGSASGVLPSKGGLLSTDDRPWCYPNSRTGSYSVFRVIARLPRCQSRRPGAAHQRHQPRARLLDGPRRAPPPPPALRTTALQESDPWLSCREIYSSSRVGRALHLSISLSSTTVNIYHKKMASLVIEPPLQPKA